MDMNTEEFDKICISEEEMIYFMVLNNKISIETAIKFHMKELTFEEVVKAIIHEKSL